MSPAVERDEPERRRPKSDSYDSHLEALITSAVRAVFDEKLGPLFEALGMDISTQSSRKETRLDMERVRKQRLDGEVDQRVVRTRVLGALIMGALAIAGGGLSTYAVTALRATGAHP